MSTPPVGYSSVTNEEYVSLKGERQLNAYQHAAQASGFPAYSLARRACMLVNSHLPFAKSNAIRHDTHPILAFTAISLRDHLAEGSLRQLAAAELVLFAGQERMAQSAQRTGVANVDRRPSATFGQIWPLAVEPHKGALRIAPRSEVVKLAANLFCPTARGMGEQRKTVVRLVGLDRLVVGLGSGRLGRWCHLAFTGPGDSRRPPVHSVGVLFGKLGCQVSRRVSTSRIDSHQNCKKHLKTRYLEAVAQSVEQRTFNP